MKHIIYLFVISFFLSSGCNYITLHRHLDININDTKSFNQGGNFTKQYLISTTSIINAITENVNSGINTQIDKMEIKDMKLKITLLPQNTATSIFNVKFVLAKGWTQGGQTLVKFEDSGKFINTATVFALNKFIDGKIVLGFKDDLIKALATGKREEFLIDMSGGIPTGQSFRASVTLELETSIDVKTCEQVPFGVGPSECF